jgi:predicted Zn-dependent protease
MTCRIVLIAALAVSAPMYAQTAKPPRPASSSAPDRANALELADSELSAGHRAEAARLYRTAADRFNSVHALVQLARLQVGDGATSAALDSLRKARARAPNSEDVLYAFAQVALSANAPLPALTALEPLTRMCPSVPDYQYLFGVSLLQGGALPEASDALREAHRLAPDRVLTLVALGLTLNGRKMYADAKPLLLHSLELEPANADALAALAEAEDGIGDLHSAETHARRALGMNENHGTANTVLGMLLMKQERYADARDALLKALASDPLSARTHYQLSLAYARLGDEAKSRQHVALYQKTLRELEDRLRKLRSETGLSAAGTQK